MTERARTVLPQKAARYTGASGPIQVYNIPEASLLSFWSFTIFVYDRSSNFLFVGLILSSFLFPILFLVSHPSLGMLRNKKKKRVITRSKSHKLPYTEMLDPGLLDSPLMVRTFVS